MDIVMNYIVSPQNLFETRTPNVTVFRDWAFKDVTKVKRGHKGGAPNH